MVQPVRARRRERERERERKRRKVEKQGNEKGDVSQLDVPRVEGRKFLVDRR